MATPKIITITGKLTKQDGLTPETGTVVFQPPGPVRSTIDNEIVSPGKRTATLNDEGRISQPVFCGDDPEWAPLGWRMRVIVNVSEYREVFDCLIPFASPGDTLDLADLIPAPASNGQLYSLVSHVHDGSPTDEEMNAAIAAAVAGLDATYATDAQLSTGLAGKSNTGHGHAITDVAQLQTTLEGVDAELALKLEADDITNLVSTESMNEGLALKLDKANGEVVDSTLTVRKGDNSSGIRLRSTGGAVDFDKMNGDVVVSSFAGPGFTGTQTGLQRWRANGNSFAGVTEFGSTPYLAEQAVDSSTGVARLGFKNGATNLSIAGYLNISGPPTTGAWSIGDVVLTNTSVYRCITAGTPGVWVPYSNDPQVFHSIEASYCGWMYEPGPSIQGSAAFVSGTSYIFRFRALANQISSINIHAVGVGTGITHAFASLHNDAGAIVGANAKSNNQSALFATGGMKPIPLITPQAVVIGDYYKARVWITGTTPNTITRAGSSNTAIINPDLTGTNLRWATAETGLTDAASAPDQIGTLTGANIAWWMGAKI